MFNFHLKNFTNQTFVPQTLLRTTKSLNYKYHPLSLKNKFTFPSHDIEERVQFLINQLEYEVLLK